MEEVEKWISRSCECVAVTRVFEESGYGSCEIFRDKIGEGKIVLQPTTTGLTQRENVARNFTGVRHLRGS